MHRMTFLIVSVDRYDPQQMFSYLGYVLEASRKFCQPTQTSTSHSIKPLFYLLRPQIKLQTTLKTGVTHN